ncbi:MAG TPA: class I adenylate-forming enzyme family protein [Sphingopyxis sp.]|nr:class I adenylate-forming enzyme family protein [Sphingopyxis sp.]
MTDVMDQIDAKASANNLAAAFDVQLKADPDAVALVIDEESWTRREIGHMSNCAVGRLIELDVKQGDYVVAQYDTSVEDLAVAIAVARLGATFLPAPKRLGMREVNYILQMSNAKLFVHTGDKSGDGLQPPAGAVAASMKTMVGAEPVVMDAVPTPADHCAIVGVTSGSTGNPKGVMHSWDSVAWAARRIKALADIQTGEAIMVTGAGAGAPGFTFFSYMGLAHGLTIVRASGWDPVRVLRMAQKHKCVWSVMVVTMLHMLLNAREEALGDAKLEHMRAFTVGGGYMTESLIEDTRDQLGVEVLRMYAMAESMAHCSNLLEDSIAIRNDYDGWPGPETEIAAFDADRHQVPTGELGEIGMRGPNLLMGYLGEPEAKQSLMTPDGFFLSGDLGRVTREGLVKILGRKKDMINRGGYKIDPTEIEELIRQHPSVCRVVVVGYPDKIYGERACAVTELHENQSFDMQELKDYLLGYGLSKEKLPERLELRAELPLSPDGKILKGAIRTEIEQIVNAEIAAAA